MIIRQKDLPMRVIGPVLLLLAALLSGSAALAEERAVVIRGGDLKERPFLDAADTGGVAANQPVTILQRQGGWVQVESGGKTGWLRVLNLRMEIAAALPGSSAAAGNGKAKANDRSSLGAGSITNPASLLRTGSSGKTVTTGVKGVDEEHIRAASVNREQLLILASLAVDPLEASDNAKQSGLKENGVEYLKKGGRK